jgi:HSP20 family molecular chaperone IbpA
MNRSLLFTLLLSTLPVVACSWMLLPRGYNGFFGPSLLDTMLSPAWTTVPSTTSLLRKFMDETTSMLPMPPSLPYEYMNHETNVTIRMKLPKGMTTDNVHVQFDSENHVLTIRGKQTQETPVPKEAKDGESSAITTPRSSSFMEFSQSFALDPDRMQLDHLSAEFSDDGVLTISVPKVEPPAPVENPNIRTIPILKSAHANGAANEEEVPVAKETAAVH